MQAQNDIPAPSLYTDSVRGTQTARSGTWWRIAASAGTASDACMWADVAALGPRQCPVTNRRTGLELCHLIPQSTKTETIIKLQRAWGRKFSPNNRFNMLLLTRELHVTLDEGYWILLPEPDILMSIEDKVRAELAVRLASGNNGAWPDFRSEEWFPIQRNQRYNYTFIPLTLSETDMPILRRESTGLTVCLPPDYQGIPVLSLHVHPYMVIVHAASRLKEHSELFDRVYSAETRHSIEFIYDTWLSGEDGTTPDPGPGSSAPRKSTRTRATPSSQSSNSSRSQQDVGGHTNGDSASGNSGGGLGSQNAMDYRVRVLRLLVLPRCMPLYKVTDPVHFLKASMSLLKTIGDLYEKGKIMHRDISVNNLMVQIEAPWEGVLIDLDHGVNVAVQRDQPSSLHRTGTLPFMALDLLHDDESYPHYHRHDLESFVYVIIWIAAQYENGAMVPQNKEILGRWCIGDWVDVQSHKRNFLYSNSPVTTQSYDFLQTPIEDYRAIIRNAHHDATTGHRQRDTVPNEGYANAPTGSKRKRAVTKLGLTIFPEHLDGLDRDTLMSVLSKALEGLKA